MLTCLIRATFTEGGKMEFLGVLSDTRDIVSVGQHQVALVEIEGKPSKLYNLTPFSQLSVESLIEATIIHWDRGGSVTLKALNKAVVGWVPIPSVYHAVHLELLIPQPDPLKIPPVRTVLDRVLDADLFYL